MSSRLGRNDPCHCGSGRKYKQCHLREDEIAAAAPGGPDAADAIEIALDWLQTKHRKAWGHAFEDLIDAVWPDHRRAVHPEDLETSFQSALIANLSEHLLAQGEIEVDGEWIRINDLLLTEGAPPLNAPQRALIVDLGRMPLRLHRVVKCISGVGIAVVDVIAAQDIEADASRQIIVREPELAEHADIDMVFGARLIDIDGHAALPGAIYPFAQQAEADLLKATNDAIATSREDGESEAQTQATVERSIIESWLWENVVMPERPAAGGSGR